MAELEVDDDVRYPTAARCPGCGGRTVVRAGRVTVAHSVNCLRRLRSVECVSPSCTATVAMSAAMLRARWPDGWRCAEHAEAVARG